MPLHLRDRAQWIVSPHQSHHGPGNFVLYWMHNAIRAHENPALEAAIALANQNGLPLLVYHAVSEKYPYASDRHHAFLIQGARDVQREMRSLGIRYAFHLERRGHRGPHLRDLTRRAAALITEQMPVPPLTAWSERIRAVTQTPILVVDAHCLAPVDADAKACRSASAFRSAKRRQHESGCDLHWPQLPPVASMNDDLGFEPLELQHADIADLISTCDIDHSIAPVADTPGGSRAGYRRWHAYRETNLLDYESRRNDAADGSGVSRMSAYLHYGMVSPWRLARDAKSAGADKFLDEMLVWRELAFHHCYHHADELETIDALPTWARDSLDEHSTDQREAELSWESLARGESPWKLWNLGQSSLIRHGELHNNLRMSWGKSFLPLTRDPRRALACCLDLNHRYALDGRSPSSYGGILWCFGLFDRPFPPEKSVFGEVRPRSIESHARRLNVSSFESIVERPIARDLPRVAIVGAGLAGLAAGRVLSDHGVDVCLFEKSRGVGGRLSTRRVRVDGLDHGLQFDHGAQYFTVRDDRFARFVNSWIDDGVVEPWMGRIVELGGDGSVRAEKRATVRHVGTPSMNAIAKHLARDLQVIANTRVGSLSRDSERWQLRDLAGGLLGTFDTVLINCPPPQTLDLLPRGCCFRGEVESVDMQSCWAALLAWKSQTKASFQGAFLNEGPLSWVACDSSKPGRQPERGAGHAEIQTWVVHASSDWSNANLELSQEQALQAMIDAFGAIVPFDRRELVYATAHRWRYANTQNALPRRSIWDPSDQVGACGDWCGGPRVEGAFLSGVDLAGAVLRHFTIDRASSEYPLPAIQQSLF
ncbi:MAG: FAD-dependent oxidoreductase [Planctomycetota bacterium]